MINHHISDEMLMSYAAGALSEGASLFVASHIHMCKRCAQRVFTAEAVGGALIDELDGVPMSSGSFDDLMLRIENEPSSDAAMERIESTPDLSHIPEPLQLLLGKDYSELSWKSVAPGIKQFILPVGGNRGEKTRLLKLSPGFVTPTHSHRGYELTMVMQGSYSDESGRYKVGDVQEADGEIDHQPIADTDEDCICLIYTDAPLEFKGVINRILQPFIGI
ncbi:ChrR family anti-sigma-E factor [Pseudovibrio exalbescens]|uniref:ChrR family anti-sigma-E factor n=1 Tax=Pseudovibrio exalbescens TaxID=197461 RepID=UPI00236691A1|nr:ChrR family anti-sigma-E factor [Pseudovibrio exalbescens]MDD7911044.1 ChrR family anti-sigma-E factor [Pseudovibrio exalbescens]